MPPIPTIGILPPAGTRKPSARQSADRRPLNPPTTLEIFGRRVSTSMTIARNVFTSETASAPASSAARGTTRRR
jgi:hypothetical protein